MKKILILGSGALKIGQAGEFDYSGSQAIKAFKEEGIETVLVNPNIATIQTSEKLADTVYFLPVKPAFVEKIIKKERPDAIALSFGGQTGLNCGIELHKSGVLEKYNVKVLGTSVETIHLTEDRQKFADFLHSIKQPTPQSYSATSIKQAKKFSTKIGFPVMIRAAYTLGGQKSGYARNEKELDALLQDVFSFSGQVLVEQYLHHFKEIEYEVIRDAEDNCVTVCNMENFDPLGIHTGESIVVAPSQTLTNQEYHGLRAAAIEIVRKLKIVGECNVQYALNPKPSKKGALEYYVIEVNARLSRSSALASKATGYPLAYVAAKLGLGKSLIDVQNQVTKKTQSCFEPALDYVVVKFPRWDLEKFTRVKQRIGSSMKSVGEVMGIGRTFEEALQKSIRMLDIGVEGVTDTKLFDKKKSLKTYITPPTSKRIYVLAELLKKGSSVKELYKETGIDPWFLYRLDNIVKHEKQLTKAKKLSVEALLALKQLGFSDKHIGRILKKDEVTIRATRKKMGITPSVFKIDTLAGEVPAVTNYLYLTYNGSHHDVEPLGKKGVMVLGSGSYRIGSSVEFDWTCVNTALALSQYKRKSIIVNCNPETVSTDYDISDRLYFEELSFERVADIYDFEQSEGVVVSVGGQTPNNISGALHNYSVPILGTKASNINRAENRNLFSKLLDDLDISQPAWDAFTSLKQAVHFAEKVEYPVLVRPSYVLSGSAMRVCYTEKDLISYVKETAVLSSEYPVTISKFIQNAKEIECDGVAQNGKIKVSAIAEHIEYAGVHSGDASIVYPPQRIYLQTEKRVIEIAHTLAEALNITGPFNIQFVAKENKVYVIEMNVRASRTLPLISKATGVNFAEVFVAALYGKAKKVELEYPEYAVVKVPQFSFSRLEGADPVLHVEMASTGEAAAFGKTLEEAFLKAELSIGAKMPQKGIFLSLGGDINKFNFLDSLVNLRQLGLPIYATEKTAKFLNINGIKSIRLHKIHEAKKPHILDYFQKGKVDLAINLVDINVQKELEDDYRIRRAAVDHNIHLLTNRNKAELFIRALTRYTFDDLEIRAWNEYE